MSGHGPPIRKISIKSWNCAWMSPQMMTGAGTCITFDSSFKTSRAFSQSDSTSCSVSGLQSISSAIHRSRVTGSIAPRALPQEGRERVSNGGAFAVGVRRRAVVQMGPKKIGTVRG